MWRRQQLSNRRVSAIKSALMLPAAEETLVLKRAVEIGELSEAEIPPETASAPQGRRCAFGRRLDRLITRDESASSASFEILRGSVSRVGLGRDDPAQSRTGSSRSGNRSDDAARNRRRVRRTRDLPAPPDFGRRRQDQRRAHRRWLARWLQRSARRKQVSRRVVGSLSSKSCSDKAAWARSTKPDKRLGRLVARSSSFGAATSR